MYLRYALFLTILVTAKIVIAGEEKKKDNRIRTAPVTIPTGRHNQQKRKSLLSVSPIQLSSSPFAETTNNLLTYCTFAHFAGYHEENSPGAPSY